MNGWVLPDDVLREAPTYTPRPHEIADLELLLSDAYAPLTGFVGQADLQSLRRTGRLTDVEGAPIAAIDAVDSWPTRDGLAGLAGRVRRIGDGGHGAFRRLRRTPA